MTADFKVNNTLIEFFGLHGQLKSYDKLVKKKELFCKQNNLNVINLYPKDIRSEDRLAELLAFKSG